MSSFTSVVRSRPARWLRFSLHARRCFPFARFASDTCGQATVEAAFLIPVIFLLLLLLLQPCILLYDRVVMEGAAAEGCRLAVTKGASGVTSEECEAAVLRHLGAIPPHELFHVHDGGCSYSIEVSGSEAESWVSVSIENKVKPIPLIDMGATLLGLTDGNGCLTQKAEVRMPSQPQWASQDPAGLDPSAWVHARD